MDVKLFVLGAALIACSCISDVSSSGISECNLFQFGKSDIVNAAINHCPVLGIGPNEYCCYNFDRTSYCCDTTGKAVNLIIMVVIAVIIVAVVLSILSCILLFLRSLFR